MDKALLILHAPTDNLVDIDNARLIYEAARHPKSFVVLDRADHLLSDSRDADYTASIKRRFITRTVSTSMMRDS